MKTTRPCGLGLWVPKQNGFALTGLAPFPGPPSSPRDSFRIFQKLSEIFSDENNYSLSRELLIKVRVSVEVALKIPRPAPSGLWEERGLSGPWAGGQFWGQEAPGMGWIGGGGDPLAGFASMPSPLTLLAPGWRVGGIGWAALSQSSPACPCEVRALLPLLSAVTSWGQGTAAMPRARSQRGCPALGPDD